jgi:tRNA(Leu) C34 or U34 (ribose-2'-O)-methylase TrmL
MGGKIASLNASVAAAIALYEAHRQRRGSIGKIQQEDEKHTKDP